MKRKTKRILLYTISSFVIFCILIYFLATSSFFLKTVGLPIVGNLIDSKIEVTNITLAPIRGFVKIDGLKLSSTKQPFLEVNKINLGFNLLALLSGKIESDKVYIEGVRCNIIKNHNGKWNIPLMNSEAIQKLKQEIREVYESHTKLIFNISNIELKNFNLVYKEYSKNRLGSINLKNLSISSTEIKSNSESKISYSGELTNSIYKDIKISHSKFNGRLNIELDDYATPKNIELHNYIDIIPSKTNIILDIKSTLNLNDQLVKVENFNTSLKQNGEKYVSINLDKTLNISFKNNYLKITPPSSCLTTSVNDFNLEDLNYFIPKNKKIKIISGIFNSKIKFKSDSNNKLSIDGEMKTTHFSVKVENYDFKTLSIHQFLNADIILNVDKNKKYQLGGSLNFLNLGYSINNIPFPEFKIENIFDTEINSDLNINIKNSTTNFFVSKTHAAELNITGMIMLKKKKKININGIFDIVNRKLLTLIPGYSDEEIVSNLKSRTAFNFIGFPKEQKAEVKLSTKLSHLSLKNKNAENRSLVDFNGNITTNVTFDKNLIEVNAFDIKLNESKTPIIDLTAKAVLPLDFKSSNSYFALNSHKIALKKIETLSKKLFKSKKTNKKVSNFPATKSGTASIPILLNLHGINLKGTVNLNGISYGREINAQVKTILKIENRKITLKPIFIDINKTPMVFSTVINAEENNNIIFDIKGKFKNLDITPFVDLMDDGSFKNVKGTVDSFSLDINGNGVSQAKLNKYLKGKLSIELSNLSIPGKLGKARYIEIIFLPLELMSSMRQLIPGGILPLNIMNAVNNTKDIFSNTKNINLKNGHIILDLNNGKVKLNKFLFSGKKTIVRKIDISGSIGLDKSLDLTTNSNISGIIFPLKIKGTPIKPIPNIPLFMSKFVADNAINMLNPMNAVDFSVDYGKGVFNTFQGATKEAGEISVRTKNTFKNSYNAIDNMTKKINTKTFIDSENNNNFQKK